MLGELLAVLRELCAWREREARARNLPRNRIVREHALWPLAKTQPDNLSALAKIEDMQPRTVRQDGEFLLDLIKRTASVPTVARYLRRAGVEGLRAMLDGSEIVTPAPAAL